MTRARIDRLRHALAADGLDGAVICKPANVFYLTGYPATHDSVSLVVVGRDRAVLVAPGNERALNATLAEGVSAVGYRPLGGSLHQVPDPERESVEALERAIGEAGLNGKRVGVEQAHVSALHAATVAARAATAPLADHLGRLRRTKDADELALIRAAVLANNVAFAAAARTIEAGVTELQVQQAVVAAIEEAVGVAVSVTPGTNAFISGPRTLLAAAPATPRRLERGDLMIVDINPYIRSYKGDTTRTFCVGEPSGEHRRMHDALVRGLEAAERLAAPSVRACDVYATLIEPIVGAGYGDGLLYHGGHAIGLEHVERPSIIPADEMPLEAGMIITLEPGVYLPDKGGVRIEDQYVVTTSGLEALSHYPRRLTACPV